MTIRTAKPQAPTVAADDVPESVRLEQSRLVGNASTASPRFSTFADLLPFSGTWVGDDLEERLEELYAARGEAEFS